MFKAGRESAAAQRGNPQRLPMILGMSLLIHLAGVPPLLVVMDLGPQVAPQLEPEFEIELVPERAKRKVQEPEPVPPETGPAILEPTFVEPDKSPVSAINFDDPPPDLDLMFERPSVELVSVRIPAKHRSASSARPGHRGSQGSTAKEVVPMPSPVENGSDRSVPVLPLYPDLPPTWMTDGLPKGAASTRTGEPLFAQEKKAELMRRVYSLSHYPDDALEQGIEGTVVVRFRLDSSGHPLGVKVADETDAHSSLREEAVRMVREAGPYPVPTLRYTFELFVAMAYLNTADARPERLATLVSSGDESIDKYARRLATEDAAVSTDEGWQLAAYSVRATFDFSRRNDPSPVMVSFEGDERWRSLLSAQITRLMSLPDKTGYLRIPIRFKITDR